MRKCVSKKWTFNAKYWIESQKDYRYNNLKKALCLSAHPLYFSYVLEPSFFLKYVKTIIKRIGLIESLLKMI